MDGQRREDCRTSTAFMSEEGAQLRTAHSGRGGGDMFVSMLAFV